MNKEREINIVNTNENRESNIQHIVTNKYIVIECFHHTRAMIENDVKTYLITSYYGYI